MGQKRKRYQTHKRIHVVIALNVMIIGILVVASWYMYRHMLKEEQKTCWKTLEESAGIMEDQINTKLESNINILRLVSDAMVIENRTKSTADNLDYVMSHLNDFQSMTIFDRIDILYKNGNMLIQKEGLRKVDLDFWELAEKGQHITGRVKDVLMGKECVMCVVPVMREKEPVALLLGVIECESFPKIFHNRMYDGQSILCIVDRPSGDFIMDTWHKTLGNIYEHPTRKNLPGYEDVDVREEIFKGNSGVIAYKSKENGQISYMYFEPIRNQNWHLLLVVQDQVIFQDLHMMKKLLMYMAIMEALLLTAYLIWVIQTLRSAMRSKEEAERQSYTDSGTGARNRRAMYQYFETMKEKENIGIIFCDINGLKEINDTKGHAAGDEVIRNTYLCLREGFDYSDVFRMGGDEFIILCSDKTEAQVQERIQVVRAKLQEKNIVVAIGMDWISKIEGTLDKTIRMAETKMYKEKGEWYRKSGKDRRQS